MKFVDKQLSIKLRNKGFNKPCFGWYYINTPTGMNEGELILNTSKTRGVAYEDLLCSHNDNFIEYIDNYVDSPTIEQVLEWLREEKDIHIITTPEKIYDYICYGLQIIQFNSPKHNFDTFRMNLSFDNIDYYDVCIIGIEYAIINLI